MDVYSFGQMLHRMSNQREAGIERELLELAVRCAGEPGYPSRPHERPTFKEIWEYLLDLDRDEQQHK